MMVGTPPSAVTLIQRRKSLSAPLTDCGRTVLGGWTAILEGGYYTNNKVSLMKVREIVPARRSWEIASTEFLALRHKAIETPSP